MYCIKDETGSYFNKNMYENVVNTTAFKVWQFVEKVSEVNENNVYKIDMRKCRRNNMYYSKFKFPVYSVMDAPKNFSGEIKCGMYFIFTCNTFPFRGSGWYYEPLVKYGIEQGIIEIMI
jgi:hypothetical protein